MRVPLEFEIKKRPREFDVVKQRVETIASVIGIATEIVGEASVEEGCDGPSA